jgi:hypothetical protein
MRCPTNGIVGFRIGGSRGSTWGESQPNNTSKMIVLVRATDSIIELWMYSTLEIAAWSRLCSLLAIAI